MASDLPMLGPSICRRRRRKLKDMQWKLPRWHPAPMGARKGTQSQVGSVMADETGSGFSIIDRS